MELMCHIPDQLSSHLFGILEPIRHLIEAECQLSLLIRPRTHQPAWKVNTLLLVPFGDTSAGRHPVLDRCNDPAADKDSHYDGCNQRGGCGYCE